MKSLVRSLALTLASAAFIANAADKKIVLVAGRPSHGPGEHEHRAGCLLFKACLDKIPGITSIVVSNGWPADVSVFDGADAVVVYADGGGGHPFIQGERLQVIDALAKKGVGIGAVHYGCEVPKEKGGQEFLDWIGGYFEMFWSVNPHWDAEFKSFPNHPVTRGVKEFKMRDEWYYHMRFRLGMQGVTPILSALPPKETLTRPDGPHSGNPHVRRAVLTNQEPQHVMWVAERNGGGRGFGFTGGHFHKNWGQDDFRKVVLNAILWIAKADVPETGVPSALTAEFLTENLDPKGRPAARPGASWTPIFDGKTFNGWRASENTNAWSIQDGVIVAHGQRSHLFYEGPLQPLNNFEFKCEVMTEKNSNGGIFFATRWQDRDWPKYGYEAQVNNTHPDPRKTGSLYQVRDVMNDSPARDGQWWTQHIIVQGKRILIKIDEKTVVDYTEEANPPVDPSGRIRKLAPGTLALQAHDPNSVVRYRNLQLKRLP